MKKLVSGAVVLFAVQTYAQGGPLVDCESITPCRLDPLLIHEWPAITYDLQVDGHVSFSAQYWASSDCQGEPDNTTRFDIELLAGHYAAIFDQGPQPDGMPYSIRWSIDGCPPLDCVNGIFGSIPDQCQ
jgi:hypothetical protein